MCSQSNLGWVNNIHYSVKIFKRRIKQPTAVINVRKCSHLAMDTFPQRVWDSTKFSAALRVEPLEHSMAMQRIMILKGMRDPYSLYMCGSLFLFSRAFEKSAGLLLVSDFTTTSLDMYFRYHFLLNGWSLVLKWWSFGMHQNNRAICIIKTLMPTL